MLAQHWFIQSKNFGNHVSSKHDSIQVSLCVSANNLSYGTEASATTNTANIGSNSGSNHLFALGHCLHRQLWQYLEILNAACYAEYICTLPLNEIYGASMLIEDKRIPIDSKLEVSSVWAIPENYEATTGKAIILAHGAGNDMHSSFVSYFHHAFAEAGLLSIKFNFPYTDAGRKAPDRMELLENTWRAVIKAVRTDSKLAPKQLFLAGKSMGGRVASHVVAQGEPCDGLIFLGYPLHPAKQTEKLRIDHWSNIHCPTLFVEGTRDSLCDLELLKAKLPLITGPTILQIVEGGDHSFKLPKSLGKEHEEVLAEVVLSVIGWTSSP